MTDLPPLVAEPTFQQVEAWSHHNVPWLQVLMNLTFRW